MLYRKGGRNLERNCRIPRISPPAFCTKAKVAKGGRICRTLRYYKLGRSWGIVLILKSLHAKAASEKAQTTVSENRSTSPKIDVFSDGHFNASSANRKQCVGVIFGTPGAVYHRYSLAVSPNVYAVFPLRLSVRVYLSSDDC